MANLSGKEIGNYRITERIGRGGMAEVYLGVHKHLDRQVAIKVLHGHLLDGGDFLTRFKREAKAVANLRHPNIVQVHDFDIQDEIIFMVMDFIDGSNLQERLVALDKKGERLSIKQIGSVINDVAAALDYAHSKGMLHRDVKPSNILLDSNGKAYLTDFGIARILSDQKLTATGTLIGTPAYMSPEQGSGEELSRESDIYSLGIVAFEMITGQVPYDARTPIAIVHKQISSPIPHISELVDDVPGSTQEVIDTALAKSPDDRYPSAEALVIALRGALQALEVSDPTVMMTAATDAEVADAELIAPTVEMQDAAEVFQPTVLMEEDEKQEEEEGQEELEDPDLPKRVAENGQKLSAEETKRKFPKWGVIIGGVALAAIVGVVLTQVFDLGQPQPEPVQASPTSTLIPVPDVVEVVFDADSTKKGLTLDWGWDSDTEIVVVGETQELAWRTGNGRVLPSEDGNTRQDWYMQFLVNDAFISSGSPTSQVRIEIEYLDEGTGEFNIQYDAIAGGPYGNGTFKNTDLIAKTDSGDFKAAVFTLSDAYFANRDNGADFRIVSHSDVAETIRRVTITLLTSGEGEPISNVESSQSGMSGEEYGSQAEQFLSQGKFAEVIEYVDLALAAGYETADLYQLRGYANTSLGQTGKAIEDWSMAIALDEGNADYWMERGVLKSEKGDLTGAAEDLNRAIEVNPDEIWYYYYLARAYYNSGEDQYMDDALEILDMALEDDPNHPAIRMLRGELLWSVYGDAENALKDFSIAIESAGPNDPTPFNMRGLFFLQSGQFELCVEDYIKFVELDPTNPWAPLERGDCYVGLGEGDLARDDYETFMAMTDGNSEFNSMRQIVQSWLDANPE